MQRLLCTIGFAGKSAEEFFALLRGAGVEQLIDVRQNRSGQLSGYAKHPDLSFFLRTVEKIDYAHEPLLAPPPELLKSYRKGKDWPAYETAFLKEMKERGVPEKVNTASWAAKVALLCSEPGPEKCHRRLVADLLAAHWRAQGEEVEVRHLVSERNGKARPRHKKTALVP
ncbi:MAG TPA: DUF488 domain-containing protein [Candidatus Acidoferrum sp.]